MKKDLVDKIKSQFDVKRNFGYERSLNLALLLEKRENKLDVKKIAEMIASGEKRGDDDSIFQIKKDEKGDVGGYGKFRGKGRGSVDNRLEKGILQSREMSNLLKYTPVELRNKIISNVVIERFKERNNENID